MLDTPASTATFRAARDLLLERREDYAAAYREFRWPDLDEFNWALDWFDVIAAGNPRTGLRVVGDDGSDRQLSFAKLSARSGQLANWLRGHGVPSLRGQGCSLAQVGNRGLLGGLTAPARPQHAPSSGSLQA